MIGAYWIVLEEEYRVFSPAGELCTILAPVKLQALKQVPLVLRPDRVKLRPEQVVSSRVSAWDWLGQAQPWRGLALSIFWFEVEVLKS